MITIRDLIKIWVAIWIMYVLLKSVMFADFKAIDWNNYKGYWSSWKYFITEQDKPIKVITFSKTTITGENCNTTSVATTVCTPNLYKIEVIKSALNNFSNSCISNSDKAYIINLMNEINEESVASSNETECIPTSKTVEMQTVSDIIYIKWKTKYINTFTLAPTWAL